MYIKISEAGVSVGQCGLNRHRPAQCSFDLSGSALISSKRGGTGRNERKKYIKKESKVFLSSLL